MKRSEINRYIAEAADFFDRFQFKLPRWALYSPEQWREMRNCREIFDCQLGWDITTFGSGEFLHTGLTLFTLRNGGNGYGKSYAEKIMMVRDRQITPRHFHWSKTEDIINRGGGNLVIELFHADPATNALTGNDFAISVDGVERRMRSGEQLILAPGDSVSLLSCHAHRFRGDGDCMIGEVSKVNDDANDNCFIDGVPRFDPVEEDEAIRFVLATDYAQL